jgi:hypothetical protein
MYWINRRPMNCFLSFNTQVPPHMYVPSSIHTYEFLIREVHPLTFFWKKSESALPVWETEGGNPTPASSLGGRGREKRGDAREAFLPSFLSAVDFQARLSNALSVSPSVVGALPRLAFLHLPHLSPIARSELALIRSPPSLRSRKKLRRACTRVTYVAREGGSVCIWEPTRRCDATRRDGGVALTAHKLREAPDKMLRASDFLYCKYIITC